MPIVRNTKGHEQIHVSNLSEATIHVDGLETLQSNANASLSSIDTKIPSALTGSGNLKVSIQELGNEGSERLNVDVGTIAQLPTALTGEGNLKVSIQEDFTHLLALEATQAASLLKHTAIDNKLPAALTGSGNLKVCLQELGNEGSERLNVDVGTAIVQLPTAVTGNGNLKIAIQEDFSKRSAEISIVSAVTVLATTQIGSDINIGTAKSIIIYGTATGNHNFNLEHSSNGSTWFLHSDVAPTSHGAVYHYNLKVEDGLQYYRLINTIANTFTLNYVKV